MGRPRRSGEAFELIHSVVDATYCVDNDNLFVAGYSTGGWLANMWAATSRVPDPAFKASAKLRARPLRACAG